MTGSISPGWKQKSKILPALPSVPMHHPTEAPTPLIPLPITGVPLERVGMDLVGPLPKSTREHKFILVSDYATCCPEAVPLWKATYKNYARELVLLFFRLDLPKDLFTDQGMLFMAQLMKDVCLLLTGEACVDLYI